MGGGRLAEGGFVPLFGVDPECGQDLGLEGGASGDEAEAGSGHLEADPPDAGEVPQRPAGGEGLVAEVGVGHLGLGQVLLPSVSTFGGTGQIGESLCWEGGERRIPGCLSLHRCDRWAMLAG